MESLLGEDEAWTRQTPKMAETGHNFWSDRCAKMFTRVFGGCFPCNTYLMATRWSIDLVTQDLKNGSK
jgi:hypothetical protein